MLLSGGTRDSSPIMSSTCSLVLLFKVLSALNLFLMNSIPCSIGVSKCIQSCEIKTISQTSLSQTNGDLAISSLTSKLAEILTTPQIASGILVANHLVLSTRYGSVSEAIISIEKSDGCQLPYPEFIFLQIHLLNSLARSLKFFT